MSRKIQIKTTKSIRFETSDTNNILYTIKNNFKKLNTKV